MSLTTKEIKQILELLEASEWDEAQVTVGEVTVTVSRNGAGSVAPAAVPAASPVVTAASVAPAAAAPVAAAAPGGHVVTAPSVGVFWRAPQPGAPPFVEVGDLVDPGKQLCIVEVMKLMTPVYADVAGSVTAVHVANGDKVEHGTPLLSIAPA